MRLTRRIGIGQALAVMVALISTPQLYAAHHSPGAITSLSITPANPSLAVTQTLQLHAIATMSNGSQMDVTMATAWSSSRPAAATVESVGQQFPGLVSASYHGSTNVAAVYEGLKAHVHVACVSNLNPQILSILPGTVTVALGTMQQFRSAEVNGKHGTEETGSSNWSVSDTSIATIQTRGQAAPGVLTPIKAGTVTVSATASDGTMGIATAVIPATLSDTYKIPLVDMQPAQTYLDYQGGLYIGGTNVMPAQHSSDGLGAAALIQPLDVNGNPNPNGNIVLLGIGMSNAYFEFGDFVNDVNKPNSGSNYPTVTAENGAKISADTCFWTFATGVPVCPEGKMENEYDRVRDTVLAPAGFTEAQVQAVWINEADGYPGGEVNIPSAPSLCDPTVQGCVSNVPTTATGSGCLAASTAEACFYEGLLGQVVRAAQIRYPNLREIFVSSRIYGSYVSTALNPDPYAYEYGFSTKWIIQAQINQISTGIIDPVAGDLSYHDGSAPWMAWGPYLWANGIEPRLLDGLTWDVYPVDDFEADGTHPSQPAGRQKVAAQLVSFFLTSPYTPWFPAPSPAGANSSR